MKKLLPVIALLIAFGARGQTVLPPLGCPTCQLEIQGIHQDDSLYLMPYRQDTLIRPARGGGLVYAYGNAWLWTGSPLHWTLIAGISFGTIPGSVTAQTNLYDTILNRQLNMVNGYGWKILNGNQGIFDSANVRKVDSMYRVNDSTVGFLINGHAYTLLLRGSAQGTIVNGISINASPLFTGPVNYVNTAGNWSAVLPLAAAGTNTILAGPATGSPGTPGFRSLVIGDLPAGIPNGNLQFSTIGLFIDQAGLVPAFSATSLALGNNLLLHLPWASAVASGPLTSANWILFNGKVDSTTMSNDSVYEWRSGGKTFRYFITGGGSGIFNLNGLTGATQMFATGISGTSPNIVSSGITHTFNYPLSNGSDTGSVTPAQVASWNGKVSDSGFSALYAPLSGIPLAKVVSGSLRFVEWDTSANNIGAIVTQGSRKKLEDSLNINIGAKMTNPMTAVGDMILSLSGGTPVRLGIGTSTYVLTSNGSTASWQPPAGGGVSDSGFSVSYTSLSGVPIQKQLSGSKRLILIDTLSGDPDAAVLQYQQTAAIAALPKWGNDRNDPASDSTAYPDGSGNQILRGIQDISTDGTVTISKSLSTSHTIIYDLHAASGFSNPMTTLGDIIVGGSGGNPTRQVLGSNGQFLGVSGGVLGYYTPPTTIPKNQYSTHYAITTTGVNPAFMIHAACILSPTTTYTYGTAIGWSLQSGGGALPDFFLAAFQSPSVTSYVRVTMPTVKNIMNIQATLHQGADGHGVWVGPKGALNYSDFSATVPTVGAYNLVGAGSNTWTVASILTGITLSTFNTADGSTSFNIAQGSDIMFDYSTVAVTYQGPNGYTIQRDWSGLGSYNAKFHIVTPSGGYLTSFPTANDRIIISPAGVHFIPCNLGTYDLYNSWIVASGTSTFLITGDFEAYILASPATSTSAMVKWQDYSGDSVYIYRGTDTTFAGATLVFSAPSGGGYFIDTGLTTNTVYYYGYYPSIAGVKTKITWFPTVINY